MDETRGLLGALVERIRSDSAMARLSPAAELSGLTPEGVSPRDALDAGADEDIKAMSGSLDRYYFSDRSMTEQYARHLYRLAERDPARLVADTVRDESRTYPRPTPVSTFLDAPFSMSRDEVDAAVAELGLEGEYADIRSTCASNGDRYLYSAAHLDGARAEGLAEWASVGERENP